ncbi:MAG: low molecular weight phosphatase family protein [Acidimicrobiales bacterium]
MTAIDRILFVCTANINRSAMAEALLRRQLSEFGVPAQIASAGLLYQGRPASPEAVRALAARGVDLGAHRSRLLSADLVGGADLVLAMAREHLREAAVLAPGAFAKTFGLKELIRLGEAGGVRQEHETLAAWLARVGAGRDPSGLLGPSPDDDVSDPVGQPFARFEECAAELDGLVTRFVDLAWPPLP